MIKLRFRENKYLAFILELHETISYTAYASSLAIANVLLS